MHIRRRSILLPVRRDSPENPFTHMFNKKTHKHTHTRNKIPKHSISFIVIIPIVFLLLYCLFCFGCFFWLCFVFLDGWRSSSLPFASNRAEAKGQPIFNDRTMNKTDRIPYISLCFPISMLNATVSRTRAFRRTYKPSLIASHWVCICVCGCIRKLSVIGVFR